jgi:hypothetical protein
MIVWELLRPIQQTLPALLDEWELEFHKCCRHNDINSSSDDLKNAKEFCINAFLSALKEHDCQEEKDNSVLQSYEGISKWLESQSPCQVIFIYKDLQNQLADHNGWMVSTNPTAHILTNNNDAVCQETQKNIQSWEEEEKF